jgi:hypothetical protein
LKGKNILFKSFRRRGNRRSMIEEQLKKLITERDQISSTLEIQKARLKELNGIIKQTESLVTKAKEALGVK